MRQAIRQAECRPGSSSIEGHRTPRASLLLAIVWISASVPAATHPVGPTRAYPTVASLPSLAPGDVVEIDSGVYKEVRKWADSGTAAKPILIRGVGQVRPVFDADGQNVDGASSHPRAVFQIQADHIIVENLEFKNARNGDNGAGIRVTSANNVTVRHCKITACDMGFMSDNNDNLLIESTEIASNGTPLYDGFSHNLYLGGNRTTVRCCYIHDSLHGQNFKTRGHYTELLYNYIADSQDGEVGLVDEAATAATNSHALMVGNIIVSKPRLNGYNSGRFIQFGQDLGRAHNGTLFAFNNTLVAGDGRIQFLSANASGATILAANNIFTGSDHVLGTVGGGTKGSNNWIQATASIPPGFAGTIQGNQPGFIDPLGRGYHLTATSDCWNKGLNVLRFLDGTGAEHSGLPTLEYVSPLQNRARPSDGQIDLGAYEYRPAFINSILLDNDDCRIAFAAVTANEYDLERSPDLARNNWATVAANIPGMDGILQLVDANALSRPKGFYRVRAAF